MALLLVTYDLKNPEQDYSLLLNQIERYSNVRLTEFSYAIITNRTPSAVCADLRKFIKEDDNLYIITLKRPYDVHGSSLANDWLNKTLTY